MSITFKPDGTIATRHIHLPLPPSLNRYYRHIGSKTLISVYGRDYRELVCRRLERDYPMMGRIKMTVTAHMPDKRRRDLDNLLKALQDSMAHANVYQDDSQIDDLRILRPGEIDHELHVTLGEPCL